MVVHDVKDIQSPKSERHRDHPLQKLVICTWTKPLPKGQLRMHCGTPSCRSSWIFKISQALVCTAQAAALFVVPMRSLTSLDMNSRSPFGTFCYPSRHARRGHNPQLPPPYQDTPTPQEPVALRGTLDYPKRTLPNMSTNVKHFGSSGSFAMAVPTSGPGAGLPSASAPGITPDSRTSIDQNIWRQGVFEHGCSESLIYENAKNG